jgi:hypothetical protein
LWRLLVVTSNALSMKSLPVNRFSWLLASTRTAQPLRTKRLPEICTRVLPSDDTATVLR